MINTEQYLQVYVAVRINGRSNSTKDHAKLTVWTIKPPGLYWAAHAVGTVKSLLHILDG